ncbi:tetratricopeptide repeat protein [bacterium]|nr:tetratricopeptide repeat protein [candidate division CSSED10-310 bacterium]
MRQNRWIALIIVILICLSGCVNKEKAINRRARILEEEANLALKTQNYTLAEQKMKEILELKPDLEHIRNNLAVLLAEYLNQPEEAVEIWSNLLKEKPHNAAYMNNIASIYLRKQEYDKALEYYKQAAENNASYHMPYFNMTHIYLAKNELEKADEVSLKGYELAVNDTNMLQLRTQVLLINSKFNEAIDLLQKNLKVGTPSPFIYLELIRIMIGKNELTEAQSLLADASTKFPENDLFKAEQTELNILNNDFSEQTETILSQIDTTGKMNLQPWITDLYRARKLISENKNQEAMDLLTSLSGKIAPQYPYFEGVRLIALARLYQTQGNKEQVTDLFNQAFRLCPERGHLSADPS